MIAIRSYEAGDFDALAALIDAASAPERAMTPTGVREFLDFPGFEPATDLFVAPAASGSGLAGARDVRVIARGDETVPILESWGAMRPDARAGGTPGALLQAALDRAERVVGERGRVTGLFQARCGEEDASSRAVFESHGLRLARALLTILRPNLENLEAPQFREGIAVRPFRVGVDEDAWVDAFNDAFADHWGGFMGMSVAFWTRYVRRPSFKPDISLVAWDGDEIAGFGHFRIDDELNALRGRREAVMRYIGVRPRWRRIGLGMALTRAGLVAVRAAGMTSVVSGVDSENVTGAHHLYEREGFVTVRRHLMYRMAVRPSSLDPFGAPRRRAGGASLA